MKVSCNLCKSDNYNLFGKIDNFDVPLFIVRCNKCGLIYQNPQPDREYIKAIYNQDYYQGRGKISYSKDIKKDRLIVNERLKIIEKIKRPSRMLDVGCHLGTFLEAAFKRGWEAYGIDISRFAVEEAKRINGLKIFLGELNNIHFDSCSFDLITCFEVIEHLPSPFEALTEMHRILKDDGLLIIQTTNMNSLMIRVLNPKYYYSPIHLYYFSNKTMVKMLNKAGFEIFKIFNGSEFDIHTEFKLFRPDTAALRLLVRKIFNKVKLGWLSLNTTMVVYAKKIFC